MKRKPKRGRAKEKAEAHAKLKRKTAPKGFDLKDLPLPPPVAFMDKKAVFLEEHWAVVEEMGRYGCTSSEIASYLGVARRTLYAEHLKGEFLRRRSRRFAASKYAVRKTQFSHAQSNIVGSIWWGKQHLRQADKRELSGTGGGALLDTVVPKLVEVLARLHRVRTALPITPVGVLNVEGTHAKEPPQGEVPPPRPSTGAVAGRLGAAPRKARAR